MTYILQYSPVLALTWDIFFSTTDGVFMAHPWSETSETGSSLVYTPTIHKKKATRAASTLPC